MFLHNDGDEPLLGPPQPKKRVLAPSILLSSKAKRLAMTSLLALGVVSFGLVCMVMLSASSGYNQTASSYLEATDDAEVKIQGIGKVAPGVIYGVAIFGGVVLGFFGYRFIKVAFFMSGFMIGLVVFFELGTRAFKSESWVVGGALALAIVGATILSLVALYLYRFGIAVIGVLAGIGFGAFLGSIFFIQLNPAHPEIPMIISMASFGVLLGFVAFLEEKAVVILCTSFLGAFFLVLGAGNFIGQYPTLTNIEHLISELRQKHSVHMPGAWWGYFAATIVLMLICVAIQVELTARGLDHHANDDKLDARRPPRPPRTLETASSNVNITIGEADANPKPKHGSFKVERGI